MNFFVFIYYNYLFCTSIYCALTDRAPYYPVLILILDLYEVNKEREVSLKKIKNRI